MNIEIPKLYEETHQEQLSKGEIFDVIIIDSIISAIHDDLEDAGFEPEEIKQFEEIVSNYTEDEIKSILAIPKELRKKNFPLYKQQIDAGEKTIEDIVENIKNVNTKNGYTLGYHATNNEILESPDGQWIINGTEVDDRDDRAMAYYSLDYDNIFRNDRRKYLYIVRASVGPDTEHKRDTSNNWGRASTLSVIHKINLTEVDIQVEDIVEQRKRGL